MATGLAPDTSTSASTSLAGDSSERLQQRLSDPRLADGLNRLLDRVDSIAFAVEAFEGFVARGDVIAGSLAATVGDLKKVSVGQGEKHISVTDLLEQVPEMLDTGKKLASLSKQAHLDELEKSRLIERLTDPKTLEIMNQMLEKLPLMALLVESLDGFL